MKYKDIERLKFDLRDINYDIEKLKEIYKDIDTYPSKVLNLLNTYNDQLKDYLVFIGPNSNYQQAFIDYKSIEYIPNPNYEENSVLSFFKDFVSDDHAKKEIENNSKKTKEKLNLFIVEENKKKNILKKIDDLKDQINKTFKYQYKYTKENIDNFEYWETDLEYTSRKRDLLYFNVSDDELPSFNFLINVFNLQEDIKPNMVLEENKWNKIFSEQHYQKLLEDIANNKDKINSENFINNLKNNFNKLKNIIQKVYLNKLLAIRNKINNKIKKKSDTDLSNERIEKQKTQQGYIYILSNKSFPNIIKIGSTMRDPVIRANELSDTSVPFPYHVEYKILTINCEILEKIVHNKLSKHRVDLEREFFNCSIKNAIDIIEETVEYGN